MSTKTQVTNAFETLLSQRKPRELNTDKGSEFTSREFQAMLARRNIQHRLKEGLNDLATVDRAMGVVKDMLAKRMGEMSGDWLTHLAPVIAAHNQLDKSTLHENAPAEVAGDDDLRFRLRVDNAEKALENIQNANAREERLVNKGGFRTLLQPMALKRRKGVPNWSSDVHTVETVRGNAVTDAAGNTHPTRLVLPVQAESTRPGQIFAGGSVPRDDRRRVLTRRHMQELKEIVARAGDLSLAQASRLMGQKQGFRRSMQELRLNFRSFVNLWPNQFAITGNGPRTRISTVDYQPQPRGTLDAFADATATASATASAS